MINELISHLPAPCEIKNLPLDTLQSLCGDIRQIILDTVSHTGGHLSSNLGAVELTVAMHAVFEAGSDPFIFDVSHQCYTHKILTGRAKEFATLRQFGGISGYTKPCESPFDYFIAGHSSTSISLAVGAAKAFNLKNQPKTPVTLIGDGALTGGMAYEALNELGERKYPCVIILNDNEMSISAPIGAISRYLSQMMAGPAYQAFKSRINRLLSYAPDSAAYMAKRLEEGIRLITPGMLFEELGLEYIGPVNGHDLPAIISALKTAKSMQKPVIVHAQTIKGKGYAPAEGKTEKWHGVGPFCLLNNAASDSAKTTPKPPTATQIFSKLLLDLAKKHDNVVGITAAMPSGTGMDALIEAFGERFWDAAIAEQHAVTSMAACAKEGFKPYIAIYSTFLQRAFDQIIHDCAILNLPVVFCIDRAGVVGEDGETHQGAFDISYLSLIPNLTLAAPRSPAMFSALMDFSYHFSTPLALRYPRGSFDEIASPYEAPKGLKAGRAQVLKEGENTLFIGYGTGVATALNTAKIIAESEAANGAANGAKSGAADKSPFNPTIIDLIFAKPLDGELLTRLAKTHKRWFIFSDSAKIGGIGSLISSFLQENELYNEGIFVKSFELPDRFITHGATPAVMHSLCLTPPQIAKEIAKYLK